MQRTSIFRGQPHEQADEVGTPDGPGPAGQPAQLPTAPASGARQPLPAAAGGQTVPLIQRIKTKQPLLDFVRRYRDMKESPGTKGEYYGKCISPDHQDSDPSFYVNAHQDVFHCKGCGIKGNVVNAYAIVNGMSDYDAKFALGRKLGVVNERRMDDAASMLNKQASRYAWQLQRKADALEYLRGRGLTDETIERWGLGFCWGTELKEATAEQRTIAIDTGLARKPDNEHAPLRSFMAMRITFPVRDLAGRVVGFAGRVVPSERATGPKYLNTPETQWFKKSELLYGATEARAGISRRGYAIVVEGYVDVVATHQCSVDNTVAVMGASANEDTFRNLWSLTKHVIFCLDGDAAGDKGTLRSVLAAAPTMGNDCRISIAQLPAGVDPDEYVLQHGPEAFRSLCTDRSTPLSRFLLQQKTAEHDLSYPEGRAKFLHAAQDVASLFQCAPLLQEQIVAEARAINAAALVDVTLEMTGFAEDLGPRELRDAIALMQRRLAKLESPGYAVTGAPQVTAPTRPAMRPR